MALLVDGMSISGVPTEHSGGRLMSPKPLFSFGGEEMRVELDKKSLFALASDTRVEILKALQPMRRTVTQLSETLDIDKAAIHRHLKKMEEGGLVKRYEDHGFVYYGLSWKARDLMSPSENTRIVILLSLTWVFSIAVAFIVILSVSGIGHDMLAPRNKPSGEDYSSGGGSLDRYGLDKTSESFLFLLPASIVALAAIVLGLKGYRRLRRPLQKDPELVSPSSRPDPD
jgi:DNA-binding transcriptional ArsR family regulator